MEEKLATTVKRDKWREKNYIKALTLTRKSCEGVSSFLRAFPAQSRTNSLHSEDFRLLVQEYEDLAD